ncbi:MAG: sulfotransferase domain-containing protein [Pseudomonadota bacterium]
MLVIANGAQKSGSTWLFNIIQNLIDFSDVPEDFLLDRKNPNSEIVYERLPEFLEKVDYSETDYLLKNHFGRKEQRDVILGAQNTLVVNIKRDLRDAIVSAYYYNMMLTNKTRSFENYYWNEGRYLAGVIKNYHHNWESSPSSRVLFMSYERLKADPVNEVIGVGRFLGFNTTRKKAQTALEATSMENLRKKYKDEGEIKFFRKGTTGDWRNHFHGLALEDIEEIDANGLKKSIPKRLLVKLMCLKHRH